MATSKKSRRDTAPPPTATRLLLIRHGEVEANYHKKFGGWIDMNLSPGRQTAGENPGRLSAQQDD